MPTPALSPTCLPLQGSPRLRAAPAASLPALRSGGGRCAGSGRPRAGSPVPAARLPGGGVRAAARRRRGADAVAMVMELRSCPLSAQQLPGRGLRAAPRAGPGGEAGRGAGAGRRHCGGGRGAAALGLCARLCAAPALRSRPRRDAAARPLARPRPRAPPPPSPRRRRRPPPRPPARACSVCGPEAPSRVAGLGGGGARGPSRSPGGVPGALRGSGPKAARQMPQASSERAQDHRPATPSNLPTRCRPARTPARWGPRGEVRVEDGWSRWRPLSIPRGHGTEGQACEGLGTRGFTDEEAASGGGPGWDSGDPRTAPQTDGAAPTHIPTRTAGVTEKLQPLRPRPRLIQSGQREVIKAGHLKEGTRRRHRGEV